MSVNRVISKKYAEPNAANLSRVVRSAKESSGTPREETLSIPTLGTTQMGEHNLTGSSNSAVLLLPVHVKQVASREQSICCPGFQATNRPEVWITCKTGDAVAGIGCTPLSGSRTGRVAASIRWALHFEPNITEFL